MRRRSVIGINHRFLSGFSFVLLCLFMGYLYLFSVGIQEQQSIGEATAIQHKRELLSQHFPSVENEDLNNQPPTTNSRKSSLGSWKVLKDNVTIHVGTVNNPHKYNYIINNEQICSGFDRKRTSSLIYVESEVSNSDRRGAIRDTWAQIALQRAINFRVVFLLGKSRDEETQRVIETENYRYGDIVQENFVESFRNLTLKSVMGLKWSTHFCSNADYVMKTDDDIFIHVPNLLRLLEQDKKRIRGKKDYVICHKNRLRNIIRKSLLESNAVPRGYRKYLVTPDELPGQYYPEYCAGFGYLTTIKTAAKLYQSAVRTPYFFIEDALVTGFVRRKAGVGLRDDGALTLRPPVSPREGSCAFREGRVTTQEMGPQEMKELWREVNTRGYFCPQVVGLLRH